MDSLHVSLIIHKNSRETKMRLSEAIALGRTLIQPVPGILLSHDKTEGCALGMAVMAMVG